MHDRSIGEMIEGWPPVTRLLKRLWHILFDDRYVALRRWRPFHFWFAWTPYIGGCVDFNIQFIPAHKARFADEDDDISWGSEFRLGADLIWVSFGLTIPNDDHPANEIKMPPRHCAKCGNETEGIIAQRCTGCGKLAAACECIQACCAPCIQCDKDCCADCGEFCECASHACNAGAGPLPVVETSALLGPTETSGIQSQPIPALKG